MRMTPHSIQEPVWTESAYGEPVATYGTATSIPMFIGWTSSTEADTNNTIYQEYEFVGLTRQLPELGSLIDGKYIIGHIEKGRFNRCFMNYAEGYDRTYADD